MKTTDKKLLQVIELSKAAVCVNCDRVFTILPEDKGCCPMCRSQVTAPLQPWLNYRDQKTEAIAS